ncbi:unnamed protein product [Bursaphelenchus okinawaensis]|uniref:Uncharacterized protein n=1 Tax=Bursaphelenchus okinawaensis TaxID=465554 RepID=A0A811KP53_9BILA|nr:unnamed protein product [Bursaphelenchus okinawaensis]CAG9107736.1 unnamed protein product [Bursaphelenchus okinawaensis]
MGNFTWLWDHIYWSKQAFIDDYNDCVATRDWARCVEVHSNYAISIRRTNLLMFAATFGIITVLAIGLMIFIYYRTANPLNLSDKDKRRLRSQRYIRIRDKRNEWIRGQMNFRVMFRNRQMELKEYHKSGGITPLEPFCDFKSDKPKQKKEYSILSGLRSRWRQETRDQRAAMQNLLKQKRFLRKLQNDVVPARAPAPAT